MEQMCGSEGGSVMTKTQAEQWIANGGDNLGLDYGLTSTRNDDGLYWFQAYTVDVFCKC